MLNIIITKHAVDRYAKRILSYGEEINNTKIKEELIKKEIKNIVLNGNLIDKRKKLDEKNAWKKIIQYNGIILLIVEKENSLFVITCLGDTTSNKWYKVQKSKDRRKLL